MAVGVTEKVLTPAAWVTATVRPATVTVAERGATLVVAAAVSVTSVLPVPTAGLTVSQPALLLADHPSAELVAVTETA